MYFSTTARNINLNTSTIKGDVIFSKTGIHAEGLGPGAYNTNQSTFRTKSHRVVPKEYLQVKLEKDLMETGRDSWIDGGSSKSWAGTLVNNKRRHIPGTFKYINSHFFFQPSQLNDIFYFYCKFLIIR